MNNNIFELVPIDPRKHECKYCGKPANGSVGKLGEPHYIEWVCEYCYHNVLHMKPLVEYFNHQFIKENRMAVLHNVLQFDYCGKTRRVICIGEWCQNDKYGVLRGIDIDKLEYRNFSNNKIENHKLLNADEIKNLGVSKIQKDGLTQDIINGIKDSLSKTHVVFDERYAIIAIEKKDYTFEYFCGNNLDLKCGNKLLFRILIDEMKMYDYTIEKDSYSLYKVENWKEAILYIAECLKNGN
jgi:hypothetical protein